MRALARLLAWPSAVGMFLVLVMGATVTNTGSAEGCGRSWPLCNGQFVPELAAASLIEYSHRAVSGVEGIMILALSIATWIGWRRYRAVQVLVPLMAGTMIVQAGLGAWAVLYPQTPWVLATHFGISLLSLASTALVAAVVHAGDRIDRWRAQTVSPAVRRAIWGLTLYTLVVVYVGAYVRRANAQMACVDWPLCNGSVFPGFAGPVGIVFTHRLAALVLTVGIGWLVWWTRRLPAEQRDLHRTSWLAFGLVVAQGLSGAVVVFTRVELFAALSHAALVGLLFGVLSYLCLRSVPGAWATSSRQPFRPQPSALGAQPSAVGNRQSG